MRNNRGRESTCQPFLTPSENEHVDALQVEAEMEQLRSREAREAEVYKRELVAWFKEQKKEQDQSRMLEEHTAKERFKVHPRYETSFERSSVDRYL